MHLSRLLLLLALMATAIQPSSAGRIGWIKANCADGEIVEAEGIVTAVFSDCVYLEDSDRAAGIRLRGFQAYRDRLYIFASMGSATGLVLQTGLDGERELVYLPSTPTSVVYWGELAPVALPNRSLGGGDFCYDASTGRGQKGVCRGCGLNTIGLLVQTCGRALECNQDERWFYIDDGSCCCGGGGHKGVRVDYSERPGGYSVAVGDFVTVTGINTVGILDTRPHAVVKLRP